MAAIVKWVLAMLAWLLAFPVWADAARIDLRPGPGMHAAEVFVVGDMDLQAAQIALRWTGGGHISCPVDASDLEGGFIGGGPNANLGDGEAMLAILNVVPMHVAGEAWLATVALDGSGTLSVVPYAMGGIPTRLLEPGGAEQWDGVCDSIGLPEPTMAVILAAGALFLGLRHRIGNPVGIMSAVNRA